MKTIHARQPGDVILPARLELVRVGPLRRPCLRYHATCPLTGLYVSADLRTPPPTVDALVEVPGGLTDPALAGSPCFLVASPQWPDDARREITEFAGALRRWHAEQKAAARSSEPPQYLAPAPTGRLRHWV